MSVIILVWVVSTVGALAFLGAGFYFGRMTAASVAPAMDEASATARSVMAEVPTATAPTKVEVPAVPPPVVDEVPVPVVVSKPEPALEPALEPKVEAESAAVPPFKAQPARRLASEDKTVLRSAFREESLVQILAELDADGTLHAVLADERGLPLAVWGSDAEADTMAAVGTMAENLAARMTEFDADHEPDAVEVHLGDGRVFQTRTVKSSDNKFLVVSVGQLPPSQKRFDVIRPQIEQALAIESQRH